MTKAKFITAGVLVLAMGSTAAFVATAQTAETEQAERGAQAEMVKADHRGGDRGKHKSRGHRGGRGGGEMFRTLFEAVDVDGDGTVTIEEINAYRDARVAEVDASGDGSLSIEEFDVLYRDFTRSRMVDAFQRLDADGDGVISPEEMNTSISRMVERMDRDGDGSLTLQRPGRGNADE